MNATTSAPQFGLTGTGVSYDQRLLGRITAQLDALKPRTGGYNCPDDQQSDDVVTFGYTSGAPVVLTVDTGGCQEIDNGKLQRLALGDAIVKRLTSLASPVLGIEWPSIEGHLRLCGGPAPSRCFVENYQGGDRVVVSRPGGSWIAMAQIRRGRFRLEVASPGSYTVALYTGNKLVKKQVAELAAGKTTKVVYPISIR
jgi:hypothetical protein